MKITTNEWFKATQLQPVNVVPGRLTIEQAVGLFDALGAVKVCVHHAFRTKAQEVPSWLLPRLEAINGKLSIAQAQKVLKTWDKWTRYDDGADPVSMSQAQSFLHDETINGLV